MYVNIDDSWKPYIEGEFYKPYFQKLIEFVKSEYKNNVIYPPAKQIFNAFELCKFDSTKVVILGQDPYHGFKQANGLAFSVNETVPSPPSLVNIFKEVKNDVGTPIPNNGNLVRWACQGILLLNATLTVQAGNPGSHQNKGWEIFTDAVITAISKHKQHIVFLLWGKYAQKKIELIDTAKHLILQSAHPSPYSADKGFFNSHPFSKINAYLSSHGLDIIQW